MPVTGCETGRQVETGPPTIELDNGDEKRLIAVCDGLREPIDALVDAVVAEGTDKIVLATENVTVKYDAGC